MIHRATVIALALASIAHAAPPQTGAQKYRAGQAVLAGPDGTILAEAEEFAAQDDHGWQSKPWGENYYAATFANTFLSRKAFLGAPASCETTVATIQVQVPKAGKYLALVRYEAAYRFETQFNLRIKQGGQTRLDRRYGARDNLKLWAFAQPKLQKEVAWYWGAVENIVWEGHDVVVDLAAGPATLELVAGPQQGDAAKRNIDVVMLTTDQAAIQDQIAKAQRLPIDGLLTQAGDVYIKLHNQSALPVTLVVNTGTEHSPYWVHARNWPSPPNITAAGGAASDWVEVGSMLDTMSDGQWTLSAKGESLNYVVEVGVRNAQGQVETLRKFESKAASLPLVYHGDTRYSRLVRHADEVIYDLLTELKQQTPRGRKPQRTVIHAYTFDARNDDPRYNKAVDEFIDLFGLAGRGAVDTGTDQAPKGYTDVRGQSLEALKKTLEGYVAQGAAKRIHTVSLGDEIGLPTPGGEAANEGFRAWAKTKGLKPGELVPGAGDDWSKVSYNPTYPQDRAQLNPVLYYESRRYMQDFGIEAQKQITDLIRRYLPNAGVGANYSPHHPPVYLGEVHKWVTIFRQQGMTQPWSEDYIWQIPVGSQQMNFLSLDMFRAGTRTRPEQKIHFYVMPHWPGNTPAQWRRQFYGDIAHGMKVVNLFEFRPVQAAYTENHVTHVPMYREVLKSFYEMGSFEDVMQDGHVRWGNVGVWYSSVGDAWYNFRDPLATGKRSLHVALAHQQVAMDVVVDEDAANGTLASYKALYLQDQNVSLTSSQKIADWVERGGTLYATAGAGMYDEYNRPNKILRSVLGVEETKLETPPASHVRYIKEDLPFAQPAETVRSVVDTASAEPKSMPVFGAVSKFSKGSDANVVMTFSDGSPAATTRKHKGGTAIYVGFLPGLSYFHPAIPRRPVDRGSSDDAMTHFIPTDFDPLAHEIIGLGVKDVERPVVCSQRLVDWGVVQAKSGTVIPLVNWSSGPVKGLTVTVSVPVPTKEVRLASGAPVAMSKEGNQVVFTLDLDVADALVLQ